MSSALGDKKGRVADSSDLTRLQRESAVLAAYTTYTGLSVNKKARQQVGADRKFTLGRGGLTLISDSTTGFTLNPITGQIVVAPYTPSVSPQAPVITTATPGNQSITIAFTLGSTGGSLLTDIYYSTDDGTTWASSGGTTSPFTFTALSDESGDLVNGTEYTVRIVAVTAAYPDETANTPSEPITVTPSASPDAPVITQADGSIQQIDLYFTLGSDGGSAVTDLYYSTDNGTTWASVGFTESPIAFINTSDTGELLVNGTRYSVRLVAVSALRPNPAANNRSEMIPVTLPVPPDAPVITSATPGDQSITIAFTLGSDGGSPLQDIYYSTDNGISWFPSGGTSSPFTITTLSDESGPLVNGTEYFIVIAAATVVYYQPSSNAPSEPSPGVTPTA